MLALQERTAKTTPHLLVDMAGVFKASIHVSTGTLWPLIPKSCLPFFDDSNLGEYTAYERQNIGRGCLSTAVLTHIFGFLM